MQVDDLFIVKQSPGTFFIKKVNINVVDMFSIRLGCGHFKERLQHLCKNLHIQSQNLAPKALAGPNIVAYNVKDG
jgi:hypothetical protein